MRIRWLLVPLLLVAVVYVPGMTGGFAFDDYANIVENDDVTIRQLSIESLAAAAASGTSGPTGRPVSMLTFAVNHALNGRHPMGYKVANLAIHLINTSLVFVLASLLLGLPNLGVGSERDRYMLSGLVALGWGAHPANLTGVLYVVQRMTSLASMFMLLAVIVYVRMRAAHLAGRNGGMASSLIAVSLCTLAAALSKEIGVLVPLFLLTIEAYLLRFETPNALHARVLKTFYIATVLVPGLVALGFMLTNFEWFTQRFAMRPFSLSERLLTESRILWAYVQQILLPRPDLYRLYHDDIAISTGLFAPWTTAASVAGLILCAGVGHACRHRTPWISFAIAWFLAGHVLESTFVPLELMHDHRNYLVSFGVVLGLLALIWRGAPRFKLHKAARIATIGFVALLSLVTLVRVYEWSDPLSLALAEAARAPRSARTQYELGRVYHVMYVRAREPSLLEVARRQFILAAGLDDTYVLPLMSHVHASLMEREQPDPEVFERLSTGLKHEPFHVTMTGGLRALVNCTSQELCSPAPESVLKLFGRALANPTISAKQKARVLVLLGAYYANVLGDYPAATNAIGDAVAAFPDDLVHRVSLIRLYLVSGQPAMAMQQVDDAMRVATQNPLFNSGFVAELNDLKARAIRDTKQGDRASARQTGTTL
jgi:hypothetical protein